MKRPSKIKTGLGILAKNIWTHIYGIITLLSFVSALFFTIYTINKVEAEFKEILYVLISIIAILSFAIIRISARYSNLNETSANLGKYERENENLITLLQLQAETTHNIAHYYRSLIINIDDVLDKISSKEDVTQSVVDYIKQRNHHFLIMLTSSLQNYFSIHTDDNCSISIKVLSNDNKRVKTIFRDPVNLKKRRQAEIECGSLEYNINENSAFSIILDEKYKDFYYAKDNLLDAYSEYQYKNRNLNWNNYYNSKIVVPISRIEDEANNRNVLGFLTVDNKNGYLVDNTSIEYLLAISDLLYVYLLKMKKISKFINEKNLNYEKTKDYLWD